MRHNALEINKMGSGRRTDEVNQTSELFLVLRLHDGHAQNGVGAQQLRIAMKESKGEREMDEEGHQRPP